MGQRAIAFKAPYGTTFVHMHDGSIWLMYNNEAKGTSDTDILNWLRTTALEHSDRVAANALAEHMAKTKPIVLEMAGKPGIAAEALKSITDSMQPEQLTPSNLKHDFGERYRIGGQCSRCGEFATGLEPQACSGVKPVEG